jgi:hypothetical protein
MRCIPLVFVFCLLMPPLAASAAQAADSGITRSTALAIPARPIATRAQLDVYIRDTPPADSPLSWLTPGARRRFIGSLVFGQRGLGGMDLGDLRYELTREQAYALLRLFGAESYALDMDARTTPRPFDGDTVASVLEPRYETLVAASAVGDLATQARNVVSAYAENFAPLQTEAKRSALDGHDVEFLFRAAVVAFRVTSQPAYLADMRDDFAELARRHRVDRAHSGDLHDALILAHRDGEARALLAAYPLLQRSPAPAMRSPQHIRNGQPSLWIATPGTRIRELVRLRFNIRVPAQVIVLASTACHFSANAARDIEADPLLRDLFREYAQWVAPADEVTAFDAVQTWNRAHPALRLGIAYDNAALPMVERFETPTFYFLDHGTVVDTVVGWPAAGNLDAIRRGLRSIHLMR